MRRTIFTRSLLVSILVFSLQLVAATRKMFPANHGSVALENRYADNFAAPRYRSLADVGDAARDGELVGIPITVSGKLPSERRYVRPAAANFMLELDTKFYLTTGHFLIVDSAVRPIEVQRRLARHNRNAAPAVGERASSHERGTTFDLAKKMAGNGHIDRIPKAKYRWLLIQLAYYQAIGRIHVIEERACLHIMVREDAESIRTDVAVIEGNPRFQFINSRKWVEESLEHLSKDYPGKEFRATRHAGAK